MICLLITSIIYILVIIFELVPIFKMKKIKVGLIYTVILAFAFVTINICSLSVYINPNSLIKSIIESFIK